MPGMAQGSVIANASLWSESLLDTWKAAPAHLKEIGALQQTVNPQREGGGGVGGWGGVGMGNGSTKQLVYII